MTGFLDGEMRQKQKKLVSAQELKKGMQNADFSHAIMLALSQIVANQLCSCCNSEDTFPNFTMHRFTSPTKLVLASFLEDLFAILASQALPHFCTSNS